MDFVHGGRGVFDAGHRTMVNDRPWSYAADHTGRIIEWLEWGEGTHRTHENALAHLWTVLNAEDPEDATPLHLVREAPERPHYAEVTVRAAALAVAAREMAQRAN